MHAIINIAIYLTFIMLFQKNHKLGAKPLNDEPFDRTPVCFNVKLGVREKLKDVPDCKERLREFVEQLIENSGQTGRNE